MRIRTPADLLAELEIQQQRDREKEAAAWVVAVVDLEHLDNHYGLCSVYGTYPTPEAALIGSEEARVDAEKILDTGEVGWAYIVLPLFAP